MSWLNMMAMQGSSCHAAAVSFSRIPSTISTSLPPYLKAVNISG
jgi:hypothetical protein